MPQKELTLQFVPGDFTGGRASAVVSTKGSIATDVVAFSLLGLDYVGQGILVGVLSSIVAGRVAALPGSAPDMIAGPKARASTAFATLLTQLFGSGRTLFLLSRGIAPVMILAGDPGRRLAGFHQGPVFGEMALFDGGRRAAAIFARTARELFELPFAAYVTPNEEEPEIELKVQTALSRVQGIGLRGANALTWELDS
jgi:hypothetical protein